MNIIRCSNALHGPRPWWLATQVLITADCLFAHPCFCPTAVGGLIYTGHWNKLQSLSRACQRSMCTVDTFIMYPWIMCYLCQIFSLPNRNQDSSEQTAYVRSTLIQLWSHHVLTSASLSHFFVELIWWCFCCQLMFYWIVLSEKPCCCCCAEMIFGYLQPVCQCEWLTPLTAVWWDIFALRTAVH